MTARATNGTSTPTSEMVTARSKPFVTVRPNSVNAATAKQQACQPHRSETIAALCLAPAPGCGDETMLSQQGARSTWCTAAARRSIANASGPNACPRIRMKWALPGSGLNEVYQTKQTHSRIAAPASQQQQFSG